MVMKEGLKLKSRIEMDVEVEEGFRLQTAKEREGRGQVLARGSACQLPAAGSWQPNVRDDHRLKVVWFSTHRELGVLTI